MNPKEIVKHELIGLPLQVVDARNNSLIGLKGKVMDETKNMLILDSGKRIIKSNATFRIKFKNKNVQVKGSLLIGRPEDRIKHKIK